MNIQEIKKYMKQQKISYEKLAEMTGLSVSTITKIFGGFAKYPRVDTMEAIEHALGLDKNNQQIISEMDSDKAKIFALYDKMTPAQRIRFIAYGEGMIEAEFSQKSNKKN